VLSSDGHDPFRIDLRLGREGSIRASAVLQAAPASMVRTSRRDLIRGADSARITPGSRSIAATTCSERPREESARANTIASYGPVRSSAVITPGRRRMASAMGARFASVWISTYAFNGSSSRSVPAFALYPSGWTFGSLWSPLRVQRGSLAPVTRGQRLGRGGHSTGGPVSRKAKGADEPPPFGIPLFVG